MHVARSVLLLMTGAASGIAFVLSCGDNLSIRADAAIDAPNAADAIPACDCPAAEPPLAGRFAVVSNTRTVAGNGDGVQGAACPTGTLLITGSCTTDNAVDVFRVTVRESGFTDSPPTAWGCSFHNDEPFMVTFRASALCLKPTP